MRRICGRPTLYPRSSLATVVRSIDRTPGTELRIRIASTAHRGRSHTGSARRTRADERRGFVVLTGRCYQQYRSTPFWPFLEVFQRAESVASPTGVSIDSSWPDLRIILSQTRPGAAPGEAVDGRRLQVAVAAAGLL